MWLRDDHQPPGAAPQYEPHLSRSTHLDELLIKVEAAPGADGASDTGEDLKRRIKDNIGVSVASLQGLERSQGKAKRLGPRDTVSVALILSAFAISA